MPLRSSMLSIVSGVWARSKDNGSAGPEVERKLRARYVDPPDIIGELDAVAQGMVFGGAVRIVQPHDHRDRAAWVAAIVAPAAHAAEQVDRLARACCMAARPTSASWARTGPFRL